MMKSSVCEKNSLVLYKSLVLYCLSVCYQEYLVALIHTNINKDIYGLF